MDHTFKKLFNYFPNIYRLKKSLIEKGLYETLKISVKYIKSSLGIKSFNQRINLRKAKLSNDLYQEFQGIVHYGYFKGLKLVKENAWGSGSDKGGMLLGIYEKEVLEEIISLQTRYRANYFIDLGAADGYFGTGLILKEYFKHAYLFDISEKAQNVIKKNAEANNISNKITVKGKVKKSLYEYLTFEQIQNSLILIDIEGAEFDLLSESFLNEVSKSYLIVELHDHILSNGVEKLKILIDNCKNHFEFKLIYSGSRDTSTYKELDDFNDHDRWILCSESRFSKGHWLVLKPKS